LTPRSFLINLQQKSRFHSVELDKQHSLRFSTQAQITSFPEINMSKFLLRTIVATALLGLASTSHAQLPPASPVTPVPSKSPSPSPTTSPQPSVSPQPTAPTTPDLTLLGKVLGVFLQTDRAQTESEIVMTLKGKAADMKVYARTKTIAKTSGEFRSEVIFAQPGQSPTATYTIVSDNSKVWIYRPDRRQYTQTTLAKFQAQPYSYLIGISSIFFLSVSEANRKDINAALAASPNFLTSLPKSDLKDLQGGRRQLEGKELYVYSYTNQPDSWGFNSLVNPQTGTLEQIEFNSKVDDKDGIMNFTLNEKIVTRNPQPAVNNTLFKFSPPKGTKKVKSLDIDLTGK
jgi:outer membrane lipoprotein-sorting protein